jgi:hypothetical protein
MATGPVEVFPALFTCVMFCFSMNLFMFFEVIAWTKGFSTLLTCNGLHSHVSSFMFFQVSGRTKSYSTLLAYIGFLCTGRSFMFFNSAQMWDGFPTWHTNIQFFSNMSQFMFANATPTKKCMSALLTYKGCLSSVTSFMPFKESGSRKGYLRILPFKWLFSIFLILMWPGSTLEFWRADSGMDGW